jgi:hypothetical protein
VDLEVDADERDVDGQYFEGVRAGVQAAGPARVSGSLLIADAVWSTCAAHLAKLSPIARWNIHLTRSTSRRTARPRPNGGSLLIGDRVVNGPCVALLRFTLHALDPWPLPVALHG